MVPKPVAEISIVHLVPFEAAFTKNVFNRLVAKRNPIDTFPTPRFEIFECLVFAFDNLNMEAAVLLEQFINAPALDAISCWITFGHATAGARSESKQWEPAA